MYDNVQIPPLIHDHKIEYPINHSSDVEPQANSAPGNSASAKPRTRARRGQATDPHSIAERVCSFIRSVHFETNQTVA